jgi:DNA-binding transcriptional LysR family regulator
MDVEGWLEDDLGFVPQEVLKSNSADLIVQFVRSGVGVACLPCYMGELETGLVRVSGVRRSQMPELWMLYSPKHRGVARIQAIAALIEETVLKLKPMIEGQDLVGG